MQKVYTQKEIDLDYLIDTFSYVNPNFEYVFGENPQLIRLYFRTKHKDLPSLLIDLCMGEKIDPFEIGKNHPRYKDSKLRSILYEFMGIKPEHKILEYKNDKLSLRASISNKEAIPIIKTMVQEMPPNEEAESLKERVIELEKELLIWKKKVGEIQNIPLPADFGPRYQAEMYERGLIEQFVTGAVPLWLK